MSFSWARPRYEAAVLVLVALLVLCVANPPSTQDDSRLALTQQVIDHGSLRIDPLGDTNDISAYGGHLYTNKPPALSFYALPFVAVLQAADRVLGVHHRRVGGGPWHRWLLRLLVEGPLLLALVFLLGRVAEGLRPGFGAPTALVLGAGTLLAPLTMVLFGHVGAALLTFGAFSLAWRRAWAWGGAVAGVAVLWEYEAVIAAAAIFVYVAARGSRPAISYLLGALPAAVALAVYDTVAFGSPLHLSYRYSVIGAEEMRSGFGLSVPGLSELRGVLVGGSGLQLGKGVLVTSPVCIAAALGLFLLWRRGARGEAALAAFVSAAFVVFDAGYFEPYGGASPGPRFLATALPFLMLGLPDAFAVWRWPTTILAVVSIGLMTDNTVAWALNDGLGLRHLPETFWSLCGAPVELGVALVFAAGAACAVLAGVAALRRPPVPA